MAVIDGGFSAWSVPAACTAKCGPGTQSSTRACDNPKPLNGGMFCQGALTKLEVCNLGPCVEGQGPLYGYAEMAAAHAAVFSSNIKFTIDDIFSQGLCYIMAKSDKIQTAYYNNMGGSVLYERMNFLRGYEFWGKWPIVGAVQGARWVAPVADEASNVVKFSDMSPVDYGPDAARFMSKFFSGEAVPSNERDSGHEMGMSMITSSLKGADVTCLTAAMLPRFPFDHNMLMKAAWDGFTWFDYHEFKYASNGDFGYQVAMARAVEQGPAGTPCQDHLGLVMSETVFSAHLTYNSAKSQFELDLTDMEQFTPILGYAKMGGKATFVFDNTRGKYGRLRTTSITYGGKTFGPSDFANPQTLLDEKNNMWTGWRFAEKCILSSLCAQTNLIMHVKGLHMEIAAAFQGTTIDAFKTNVKHPLRRLLDQFTHRNIQSTNGNWDLLFANKAAEFSLAPLYGSEQLRLIGWYVENKPLSMSTMSMPEFAASRGMSAYSVKPPNNAAGRPTQFFWRWHYRATKAQTMMVDLLNCWVGKNGGWDSILQDPLTIEWWTRMRTALPSISRAIDVDSAWISAGVLNRDSFTKVVSTIMVWVTHIHEDVGHSASYVVYNPVITPMQVPADGIGVPFNSFAYNTNAYRTFVFLERAKLLETPPDFWFIEGTQLDKSCYTDMQATYTNWGATDDAFSDCGPKGFYSCVEHVETSVSS